MSMFELLNKLKLSKERVYITLEAITQTDISYVVNVWNYDNEELDWIVSFDISENLEVIIACLYDVGCQEVIIDITDDDIKKIKKIDKYNLLTDEKIKQIKEMK